MTSANKPTPRPVGRPPQMAEARRVNIYLPPDIVEKAKAIGGGNVSAGIRQAVERHKVKSS